MLLAIDVGNTNTVFAVFKDDTIFQSWRCKTVGTRSVDEYAVFLNQLFNLVGIKWADIDDVIISSVVPEANFHLEMFCQKYISCTPIIVKAENVDLEIKLDRPQEIGADRLVNAMAVCANYQTPAIVIDFGTATTFDVIDKSGSYCGGVIAPGVRLSLSALSDRAAKLPQIDIERPAQAVGKNTRDAMCSGMYWGYIGLVEGILKKIKSEVSWNDPYILATGGLAPLYAQEIKAIDMVDSQLIFKGLLEIYKKKK